LLFPASPVPWARLGSSVPPTPPQGVPRLPSVWLPLQGGDRAVTVLSCLGSCCKAFRFLRRFSVVSPVPDVCQGAGLSVCDRRLLVVSYVLVRACIKKQAVSKWVRCVSWDSLSKHPIKGSTWETKELWGKTNKQTNKKTKKQNKKKNPPNTTT